MAAATSERIPAGESSDVFEVANMALTTTPTHAADVYWRHAWDVAGERYAAAVPLAGVGDQELRAQLLFCLIGGHGISYEHNLSVADRLWALGLFRSDECQLGKRLIEAQLRKAQFDPPRRDGQLRRYRFPKRKADLLYRAQLWLRDYPSLAATLTAIKDERDRRDLLCDCPGIGPKSASWLLRNCGYAERLAVLDIHVLRAMQSCGRIDRADLARDYEFVEAAYLGWCREYDADPARFDLLVWDFSRHRV